MLFFDAKMEWGRMEGRKYNARGKQIEEIFWGQSILQDGVGNFAAHDYPELIYKFCKFA